MQAMMRAVSAFLLATALALSFPCSSQAFRRLDVVMKPFEAIGGADPELAVSLSRQLMQAIERRSDFRVTTAGAADYYLKGEVSINKKQQFVTLRIFEAWTDRMVWIGNYERRNTSTDKMADEVVTALSFASPPDAWP